MTKEPSKGKLGGAKLAAVSAVTAQGASALSVAEAGSKLAFLDSWTRAFVAYARRLRADNVQLLAPVMLVHVDDCGKFVAERKWNSNPLLGMAPTDDLAGMLAVGTAEFGGCLHPQKFKGTGEFAAEIENSGLGNSLTIALMSVDVLYVWPQGVHGSEKPYARELDMDPIVIDSECIERELDLFYTEEARDRKKWWKDSEKRITVEGPEGAVQETLRVFLLARCADYAKVREEIVSGNGRTDITIQATNGCDFSVVLELKTIRDVRTPKRLENKPISIPSATNTRWALSGIQQAAAYRDRERFKGAFLCLYDFCAVQGEGVESTLAMPAARYGVRVKRYWISASHEEMRDAMYPVG